MPKIAKIKTENLPIIALVGRTNVGKSTLFNRVIEEQKAIVSNTPGTTRTSNKGIIWWRGKKMEVIDTGGLTFEDNIPLEEDILAQSEKAIKTADIILFLVDAKDGLMPQERELAKRMRRITTKHVLLVANKADKKDIEDRLPDKEFHKLGLGGVFPIAAASGRNVGDLLDIIYEILRKGSKRPKKITDKKQEIRVSIIGKPNVGKSSLFNKIIGEEKVIVSDMPHTTREPHDTSVIYANETITFVDTAGIRRKTKVKGRLEQAGIQKSIKSVEESDIVLFVINGREPLAQQDMQLGGLVKRRGKSVIILINKWDLATKTGTAQRAEAKKIVYGAFPHLDFAPIVFVSGKTGYGVHKIFPEILKAWRGRHAEISEFILNNFLKQMIKKHKPSRGKGTRHPKILALRQLGINPPIFEMMIKFKTSLHRSYVNFIERKLREQFDLYATPIIIKLSKLKR